MYTIFTWDICRRKTKNKARELIESNDDITLHEIWARELGLIWQELLKRKGLKKLGRKGTVKREQNLKVDRVCTYVLYTKLYILYGGYELRSQRFPHWTLAVLCNRAVHSVHCATFLVLSTLFAGESQDLWQPCIRASEDPLPHGNWFGKGGGDPNITYIPPASYCQIKVRVLYD